MISQRQDEILDAAAKLFLERGYDGASVRELARRLGISTGTLYYHIGDKAQLLVQIHDSFIDKLLARLRLIDVSALDPEAKLREFLRAEMGAIEHSRTRAVAFLRERRALPEAARERIQTKRDEVDQILERIISEGIAQGIFREVTLSSARLAILGMANWAIEWFNPAGRKTALELADEFADLVLAGLKARADGTLTENSSQKPRSNE